MRELTSKGEIERKEKKNRITLGIVMAILMLLSTAGYALLNRESTGSSDGTSIGSNPSGQVVEYNRVKFVSQESGLWAFNIDGNLFYSSYTPEEVKNINVPFITLQSLAGQTIYYSGNTLAIGEIIGNINPYITRSQEACYLENNKSNEGCDINLPVRDCTNNFIIIKDSEEQNSRITLDNKCIIVKAKDGELLKSSDALLFRILGIQ